MVKFEYLGMTIRSQNYTHEENKMEFGEPFLPLNSESYRLLPKNVRNYNIARCFVWVRNCFSRCKGGT
jgi:hypothetical protein